MIYFNCDYTEGAHPSILEKLAATNLDQTIGYGMDEHCKHAAELIKKACNAEDGSDFDERIQNAGGTGQLLEHKKNLLAFDGLIISRRNMFVN